MLLLTRRYLQHHEVGVLSSTDVFLRAFSAFSLCPVVMQYSKAFFPVLNQFYHGCQHELSLGLMLNSHPFNFFKGRQGSFTKLPSAANHVHMNTVEFANLFMQVNSFCVDQLIPGFQRWFSSQHMQLRQPWR